MRPVCKVCGGELVAREYEKAFREYLVDEDGKPCEVSLQTYETYYDEVLCTVDQYHHTGWFLTYDEEGNLALESAVEAPGDL